MKKEDRGNLDERDEKDLKALSTYSSKDVPTKAKLTIDDLLDAHNQYIEEREKLDSEDRGH